MKILFLDDDPVRHHQFRAALNGVPVDLRAVARAVEAIAALEQEQFDIIFLDHDLGWQHHVSSGPGTGCEVAQRLMATANREARLVVHSQNEDGTREMLRVLGSALWIPFPQLIRAGAVWRMVWNADKFPRRAS